MTDTPTANDRDALSAAEDCGGGESCCHEAGWRLYADAGNTALKWAVYAGDGWILDLRLPTESLPAAPEMIRKSVLHAGLQPDCCAGAALVCSVAGREDDAARALFKATGAEVALLGRDLHSEVSSTYADPRELGQDRLALAEGALALVGAPVIVISLGTCITAQWLDAEGLLVGGAITAGLQAQIEGIGSTAPHLRSAARSAGSALRRKRRDERGKQSTQGSLMIGIEASVGGAVRMLEERGRAEVGNAPVIATGGDAALLERLGASFDLIEPLLVLEGLRAVDERSRSR